LRSTTTTIARLERGFVHQQDLIAEARRLRGAQGVTGTAPADKDELQKQAADLQAKMASADSDAAAELRKELNDTNSRLKRIEQEGDSAQNLIRADVDSVCLLHVAVAFRNQQSGQRLRYAGLNQQGEPLQDSDGNPVLTMQGSGPEVRVDVSATGFPAGPEGTHRHEQTRRATLVGQRRAEPAHWPGIHSRNIVHPRIFSGRSARIRYRD